MELNPENKSKSLESQVIGCSLSVHWWGINKQAGVEILSSVADTFGANRKFLKIEKKLINIKNIYYKNLCETKGSIVQFWKQLTLPYVESGVRLIKKDLVDAFEKKMETFKLDLQDRVTDLSNNYEQLKQESQTALQGLFNAGDYPENLSGMFSFHWDYPNLNPPEYLLLHNPALYRRQQEEVRAKFEKAVVKAEQAFGSELQSLVTRLAERMSPNEDGSRKVFRDSTVTDNFKEFFERFKTISVCNSTDLQDIVDKAEKIISGVDPSYLKSDSIARQDLASQMMEVSKMLEDKIGVQARRVIEAPSGAGVGAA